MATETAMSETGSEMKQFDMEVTCTKKLRVTVEADEVMDGEDWEDVAKEIATEGFWSVGERQRGRIEEYDSEMQVEEISEVK